MAVYRGSMDFAPKPLREIIYTAPPGRLILNVALDNDSGNLVVLLDNMDRIIVPYTAPSSATVH